MVLATVSLSRHMEAEYMGIFFILVLSLSLKISVSEDPLLVEMWKFSYSRCITTGLFKKIYKISPEKCVEECSSRPKCKSFNYRQRFLSCEMSSDTGVNANLIECPGSVHSNIDVENLKLGEYCKSLNCSVGQKCVRNETGYGRCIYEECELPVVSDDMTLLGNVYDVGRRMKLQCNGGKVLIGKSIIECRDNGTWTEMGICMDVECPEGRTFCYKFESNYCKNWTEARTICQMEKGDLMVPDKNTFLFFQDQAIRTMGTCRDFWIGAYTYTLGSNFETVTGDIIPNSFPYWNAGQPNGLDRQYCVEMRKGYGFFMNDFECDVQKGFICQIFL